MSIKITSAIWKYSAYREEKLLVLLALGDWANDRGVCWPSMSHIAEKARITERGAIRIMRHFVAAGVIEVLDVGGGRGHVRRYRIKGEPHTGFDFLKAELRSSFREEKDDPGTDKRMTLEARKDDRGDVAIRKNRQEPSVNQPPLSTAGAALRSWRAIKQKLRKQLGKQEWQLWIRPTYLLKVMGDCLLLAQPPSRRIVVATRARLPTLLQLTRAYGYDGAVLTRYPDDYDRERLRKEYPEFYRQMLGNGAVETRCEQQANA